MLAGLLLVAAGVLKLGFLADFISHPVLAGFKAGTGLLIAVGQLGKVLGIEQTGDSFFEKRRSAIPNLGDISWPTAGLAAATIAGPYALKRTPIPGALIAVGAGVAVGALGLLDVALTGAVPSGLPTPVAPDLGLIGPLLPAAAGIALMSFVESIAAGRAIVHPGEPEPEADRELLALGAANLAGGVFRALPAGGGLSQTAVNDSAETSAPASSRPPSRAHAAVPDRPVRRPPAGHARRAGAGLRDRPRAARAAAADRPIHRDGVWLGLVTIVAVLALGVLEGVLVGVLASMLSLVHALNHPRSSGWTTVRSSSPARCTSRTSSAYAGRSWRSTPSPCWTCPASRHRRDRGDRAGGARAADAGPEPAAERALRRTRVARQRRGELALRVQIDVVGDVDLDLDDRPAAEVEAALYSALTGSLESRPIVSPSPHSAKWPGCVFIGPSATTARRRRASPCRSSRGGGRPTP